MLPSCQRCSDDGAARHAGGRRPTSATWHVGRGRDGQVRWPSRQRPAFNVLPECHAWKDPRGVSGHLLQLHRHQRHELRGVARRQTFQQPPPRRSDQLAGDRDARRHLSAGWRMLARGWVSWLLPPLMAHGCPGSAGAASLATSICPWLAIQAPSLSDDGHVDVSSDVHHLSVDHLIGFLAMWRCLFPSRGGACTQARDMQTHMPSSAFRSKATGP